ncbi:MAG: M48 family metalloprotease [Verrucomicrobia bacterium]|nr:M48 family metalloprotease [Verrucomicrobiota bacterium]
MNVRDVLGSPASQRFAVVLLHFLWQGFLVALLAVVGARIFGRTSSRVRYGVHVAALVAMVLAVAGTYIVVGPVEASRAPTMDAASARAQVDTASAGEMADPVVAKMRPAEASWEVQPAAESAVRAQVPSIAVGVYILGVLVMMGRLLIGLQGGGRLRRHSQPVDDAAILQSLARQARGLGLAFAPAIAYCSRVVLPTVVGVLRPVILLPFSFASGLATEQVEAVLAHELAHIRRLDPLVNIIQRVIEALLFFHPAVWFVSHRIRVEREHCCDDLVVHAGASAPAYAASLVEAARQGLAAWTRSRPVANAVGLADRPSQLRARIQRLLGGPPHERIRLRWTWVVGLVAAAAVGLVASVSMGGDPAGDEDTTPVGDVAGSDASLRVDIDFRIARVSTTALEDIVSSIAPDAGDPIQYPLVLSDEQRTALDAALAGLPGAEYTLLSSPRLTARNRRKASIAISHEGDDRSVKLSCTPLVSDDGKSVVLVLHEVKLTDPAVALRPGPGALVFRNPDGDGVMVGYRIANGDTLVLEAAAEDDGGMMVFALVRARLADKGLADDADGDEMPEARQQIMKRLETIIPEVDFREADLKELLGYLGEAADVKIVIDPEASKLLEDGAMSSKITIKLENVPLKDVIKYSLRYKGLKYVVEDDEILVVPIDKVPAAEFETEVFNLSVSGVRTIVSPDGEREEETIDEHLRRAPGVVWPVGSTISYDKRTETLTVSNTEANMAPIRESVLAWEAQAVADETDPVADEAEAARQALIKKLDTIIPAVDFSDLEIMEIINFLSKQMGVKIVVGPVLLGKMGGRATLKLKNARFRDVLTTLLAPKGLTFVVEDGAIVIVPIAEVPPEDGARAIPDEPAGSVQTEIFRLLSAGGTRTVLNAAGESKEETIDKWLRRAEGVTWPEGSRIVYRAPTGTLIVTNTAENLAVIRELVKAWEAQEGDGATTPAGGDQGEPVPDNGLPGEQIETAVLRLAGDGTCTTTDADGKPSVVTIDERLRRAEGVTWPRGSSVRHFKLNGMLIVTNTAGNVKLIRELVKEWDTPPADLNDETGLEFGIQTMRVDAAAYARIKKTVLGERDDWRKPSLILNAEATGTLMSALKADPSCKHSYMTTVGPATSGQPYCGSVADPDDESDVWYDIAYTATVLPDSTGFKLVLDPEMADGEFGCLFHIDAGALVRSDKADGGHQAVYELKHGDTILLDGVEKNKDGQMDVAFMHVRVFDEGAFREAQEAPGN